MLSFLRPPSSALRAPRILSQRKRREYVRLCALAASARRLWLLRCGRLVSRNWRRTLQSEERDQIDWRCCWGWRVPVPWRRQRRPRPKKSKTVTRRCPLTGLRRPHRSTCTLSLDGQVRLLRELRGLCLGSASSDRVSLRRVPPSRIGSFVGARTFHPARPLLLVGSGCDLAGRGRRH
jgi:hypothetical protein